MWRKERKYKMTGNERTTAERGINGKRGGEQEEERERKHDDERGKNMEGNFNSKSIFTCKTHIY